MTRAETKTLIHIMSAAYANYHPDNLSETIDTWALICEEYDYNTMALGLKAYIQTDTSGFAPTIGQILDKVQAMTEQELTPAEAWQLVRAGIRNGTYGALEEFNKLPPLVQKAVGGASQLTAWATSDYDTLESVAKPRFEKAYEATLKRYQEAQKTGLIKYTALEAHSAPQIEERDSVDIITPEKLDALIRAKLAIF